MTKSDKKPAVRNSVLIGPLDQRTYGESQDLTVARKLTRPEVQAATVIQRFEGDNHEVNALIEELSEQVAAVNRGDMSRPEAMLVAQSHTLDEIFAALARRAQANISEGYSEAGERYMRLAFKAQSQCRTTIETLTEIKNPRPVAFVRQANISNGPQQINNGQTDPNFRTHTRAHAGAGDIENPQSKLLEAKQNEWMDTGAAARQAALIQRWKPWERSTGPTTEEGKARVAGNACKGGERQLMRALAKLLR